MDFLPSLARAISGCGITLPAHRRPPQRHLRPPAYSPPAPPAAQRSARRASPGASAPPSPACSFFAGSPGRAFNRLTRRPLSGWSCEYGIISIGLPARRHCAVVPYSPLVHHHTSLAKQRRIRRIFRDADRLWQFLRWAIPLVRPNQQHRSHPKLDRGLRRKLSRTVPPPSPRPTPA